MPGGYAETNRRQAGAQRGPTQIANRPRQHRLAGSNHHHSVIIPIHVYVHYQRDARE